MHATVCHGEKEWTRDDNGDGIREVHVNTTEGVWTTVRNFLRPLRGVQKYLSWATVPVFAAMALSLTSELIARITRRRCKYHLSRPSEQEE